MSQRPLTQPLIYGLVSLLFGVACGKDSILEAVDEMEQTEGSAVILDPAGGEPMEGTAEEPEPGIPEEPTPAPPGTEEFPAPPKGTDGLGQPKEPDPGVPEDPEPAPAGSPGGAHHANKEGGKEAEGPFVNIQGRVDAEGGEGKIRIDLFDGDQRNVAGPRPKVVGVHEIDSPGPFEISIPASDKRVWIGAYRDKNGNNRPDKGEPAGWYSKNPVFLDSQPDTVVIVLTVEGKSSGLGLDFGGQ